MQGDRDPARDLSALHHICVTSFKDLQNMSRNQVCYSEKTMHCLI